MVSRNRASPAIFACLVVLFGACGAGRSASERILADETFFKKSLTPMVGQAREQCKKKLETTFAPERLRPGTDLDKVSTSVGIDVPPSLQPNLGAIEAKYGKPDKVDKDVSFYGDVGFQAGTGSEDGKVVAVVITCTLTNIKAKQ